MNGGMTLQRVVVTGMGTVNPLGHSVAETVATMDAGKIGIRPITKFDAEKTGITVAGEVEGQGVNLALPRYGHLAARYAYPVAVYSLRYPMKPASERERRIEVFGSAADGPGSRVRIVSEVGDYIISTVGEVVFVVVVDTYRLGCKVDAESVARSCIR